MLRSEPTERDIEKKTCKYASDKGWLNFKFVSPTSRGVPDRIYLKDGMIFFIEFKTRIGKLSKYQEHIIRRMQEKGARIYIVSTVQQGMLVVDHEQKQLESLSK